MTDPIATLLSARDSMSSEAFRAALDALSGADRERFRRLKRDSYFVPENAHVHARSETLSPNGKYRLVVTPFATRRGSWDYTQGLVYLAGSDAPIAEIRRNYSSFPHLFVEHPNGNEYLVCGEDYQGQTVIELDTGRRRDHLPDEAKRGAGFCWSMYRFDAATRLLIVAGCYWACPYEYRFYDFADPMAGWPELATDDEIYDDDRWPEIMPDGSVRCFQSAPEPMDTDDEVPIEARPIVAHTTYRRDGAKLVRADEWVSDDEKTRRAANEEARRKAKEWRDTFRATDPLYLRHRELMKHEALSPNQWESQGVTYEGWCPGFATRETRWCQRIVARKESAGVTIDLEWGALTGPIKLVVYRDGKHAEDRFYPHSIEGMERAYEEAVAIVKGGQHDH